MAKKAVKKGAEFIAGVLEKVPEEQRAAVKAALEAEEVLDYVGSHALRQDEFSAAMEEAKRLETESKILIAKNQEWYQDNLPLLNKGAKADELDKEVKKLNKRLKAIQEDPDSDQTDITAAEDKFAKATENLISKEAAKAMVDEAVKNATLSTQANGLDLVITMTDLASRHLADFREPLDSRALILYAQKNSTNIVDAYNRIYAEKIEGNKEAKAAEERAALKKQLREELIKEMPAQGHGLYPVGTGEPISSTLGALTNKPAPGVDIAARAAAAYQDLLAKRGA